MELNKIRRLLRNYANPEKAKILQSFFKTAPGEYGQGDIFMGVCVPQIRSLVQTDEALELSDINVLLKSKFHEERLLALLILVKRYQNSKESNKKKIFRFYLKSKKYINNWDLVDLSAGCIVGDFLFKKDKQILFKLTRSHNLWERRIAICSTYYFIKNGHFKTTLDIAAILLKDKEDLIHKALGWMLREVGKRDLIVQERFLKRYYGQMPRTMLRYAIEKFPELKRQAYLKGKF
ncbi:MAG: DNA alkylation repair protein [Candidatus Omnitrophota bacterium]